MRYRYANQGDIELLFNWINDPEARKNSYQKEAVNYEDHVKWFTEKMNSGKCLIYLFLDNDEEKPVGQVRIEKINSHGNEEALISISIDADARGKGYASKMIKTATSSFGELNPGIHVVAYVFMENKASYKSFLNAGYLVIKETVVKGVPSYILGYTVK